MQKAHYNQRVLRPTQLKVPPESSANPDDPPILIIFPIQSHVGASLLPPNTDQLPQELKKDQRKYNSNITKRPTIVLLIFLVYQSLAPQSASLSKNIYQHNLLVLLYCRSYERGILWSTNISIETQET